MTSTCSTSSTSLAFEIEDGMPFPTLGEKARFKLKKIFGIRYCEITRRMLFKAPLAVNFVFSSSLKLTFMKDSLFRPERKKY